MRDGGNILDISALKPDYMGFIFYPESKRYFGNNLDAIRELSSDIKKTGVFVDEDPVKTLEIADKCRLDLIQLHGSESASICHELKASGYSVVKTFSLDENFDFSLLFSYEEKCDYFLFDTKSVYHGGSGIKFNWELLNNYTLVTPFFLSGGIGPGDINAINSISHPALYAVDINSRFELTPGIKNSVQVKKFIETIRSQHQK